MFMITIDDLVDESFDTAREKGWWEDDAPNIPEKLALIHSEVSEALEDYRTGASPTQVRTAENGKPEGFGIELADTIIRIADLCGYLGIDLTAMLQMKMAYNKGRPYRHGGKKA